MLTFNFLTIFPPFERTEINSKKYPPHFPELWRFTASTAAIQALSEQQPAGTAPLGCQVSTCHNLNAGLGLAGKGMSPAGNAAPPRPQTLPAVVPAC